MRLFGKISTAAIILGGMAMIGCHNSPPDAPAPIMPTPEAAIPTGTPPAAKDLTHVLTKEEPFFLSDPGPADKPAGMLASGSKVLVLIPGATYSQVITDKGISAYVPTDGLSPLGK